MTASNPLRPPFPRLIDSSMRASFVSCPRQFELQYLHHWRSPRPSIHLVAGGAFAKGIEVTRLSFYRDKLPPETSLGRGVRALILEYGDAEFDETQAKDCLTMCCALAEYFSIHELESDEITPLMIEGSPCVEFSFALPLPLRHPETDDPILYGGRFDMLGLYNGALFAVDEKTTSQLGPSWIKNWTLRSQLTGYCWGAREYGYPVAGAIIRGLSILKSGFGNAESIQYRPDWQIARWHSQLIRDISRMISCWSEGYFDYNLDSSCSSYGGCAYLDICNSNDPQRWLGADFIKREWHPLSHPKGIPSV